MTSNLSALYRHRELLFMLALRDIRLRYKQTAMGALWALLMPVLLVGAGIVVRLIISRRGAVVAVDIGSIIVKSLPWAFFTSSIRFATISLIGNSNLVAKMAFPKEVFPLAAIAACFTDFLVALVVGSIGLVLLLGVPSVTSLAFIPILAVLMAFTVGLALLLSSLNLFFRDTKYIVEVILSLAIFFTPVFYDIEMLGKWAPLAMLNPVAPLLEALREAVVLGRWPDSLWLLYSATAAVVVLLLGYRTFKGLEIIFAERV